MRRERKHRKCKIQSEHLLWVIVGLMVMLIVKVNFMLLQQAEDEELPVEKVKQQPSRKSPPNKEPLIDILRSADVEDTPELRDRIPSWQEVVERFGDKPKIIGLETCAAFRENTPTSKRIVAPAGIFNSGTNMLFTALNANCHPPKKGRRRIVKWQVNWGKHQPPRFRFDNYVDKLINNAFILPVVIVRDPYTWMQSMCKTRYSAHWYHVVPDHCPNLIPNHVEKEWFHKLKPSVSRHYNKDVWKVDNVMDKANYTLDSKVVPIRARYKSSTEYHTSLAHMWKDWYQEYYDAAFPRLMIRLEDVVFHPEEVLKQVCDCMEGTFTSNLTMKGESAKNPDSIHGRNLTNLADAMVSHVYSNQTRGMSTDDLQYAKTVLKNSVMSKFGYHSPD